MAPPSSKSQNAPSGSNFIRQIVEHDLANGKHKSVRTRFPPEPNGYLHFGHAKSICLNFGLARDYGGVCHLRFDDTNPAKEEQEYVDSIIDAVRWLGFDWGEHQYFASDYFDTLYGFARNLVERGLAYVDSLTAEEMRAHRGTLTEHGRNSPFRDRAVDENLRLLQEMKEGKHADGSHVLRARIDMQSGNINLRDPVMYRIRHAEHHRTGGAWCIYPSYDWAHGVSDAIERITHSICTLEFEDHRPLYDWFNERLAEAGLLERPLPQQIEFARLNLGYVLLSKRKLIQLVDEGRVEGWDDPRMPTLVGARRRGYTPEGFRLFAERIGVAKADSWIDFSILEDCMREHLNQVAPRRIAVLDPLKLVIENYPEGREELCEAPNHPQKPDWGKRQLPFLARAVDRARGLRRRRRPRATSASTPATRCACATPMSSSASATTRAPTACAAGRSRTRARAPRAPTPTRSRAISTGSARSTPTPPRSASTTGCSRRRSPKAWPISIRESKKVVSARLEPALREAEPEERFQFERHGYFVADREDPSVFNRTVTLRDSWTAGK